jgi:hypothetical protein
MKRLGAIFIFIAFLMPFAAAHAALIVTDSPLGPATAVLDTDSGLEWLKLSATQNMSVKQGFAEMEPGEILEGFHYATSSELSCSLLGPHLGLGCHGLGGSKDVPQVQAFLDLFGLHFFETFAYGIQPPDISRQHGWIEGYAEANLAVFFLYPEDVTPVEYDSQLLAVPVDRRPQLQWIVRQAQAVPEPSTLALLGLGVVGLVALRKKGRSRSITAQG